MKCLKVAFAGVSGGIAADLMQGKGKLVLQPLKGSKNNWQLDTAIGLQLDQWKANLGQATKTQVKVQPEMLIASVLGWVCQGNMLSEYGYYAKFA